MVKAPLFKYFFITLVVVGVWNFIAYFFHLFSTIPNFDMSFHFLGGFFVAISTLTVLTRSGNNFSYGQFLFWGIVSAVVVGLLWEFFELYFGITYLYSPDYIGDNGMDVTMDIAGGLTAVWFSYLKLNS